MAVSKAWSFQRKILRQVHNKRVNEYFRDIPEDDLDDITTARKNVRAACLIGAADSQNLVLIKMQTFWFVVQELQYKPDIYGLPLEDFHEQVEFKPQVCLQFAQDRDGVPDTYLPIRAQIKFRLMNELTETMTKAKAEILANKINTVFGVGDGYRFSKGKVLCLYRDQKTGYQLKLFALNPSEGREVIRKVLDISDRPFDEKYLKINVPEKDSDNTPRYDTIMGKRVRLPRWRPTATVRFRYAVLRIHGLMNDIVLVDKTGTKREALRT